MYKDVSLLSRISEGNKEIIDLCNRQSDEYLLIWFAAFAEDLCSTSIPHIASSRPEQRSLPFLPLYYSRTSDKGLYTINSQLRRCTYYNVAGLYGGSESCDRISILTISRNCREERSVYFAHGAVARATTGSSTSRDVALINACVDNPGTLVLHYDGTASSSDDVIGPLGNVADVDNTDGRRTTPHRRLGETPIRRFFGISEMPTLLH